MCKVSSVTLHFVKEFLVEGLEWGNAQEVL